MFNYKAMLLLTFILGCQTTYVGYTTSTWLGSTWLNENADYPWVFSSYISVQAKTSLQLCGILSLWTGGLLAGVVALLLWHSAQFCRSPHLRGAIILMMLSLFLTGFGFNTLDWMLSRAFGSNEMWNPWMLGITHIYLDSWTFYILFSILPLFFGGFLIGFAITYLTVI